MLTQARLRELLTYDPETGLFHWRVDRARAQAGDVAGSTNGGSPYLVVGIDYKSYTLHRLAWLYMTGEWPEEGIDHKNGNPADNSWANLRKANCSQNAYNQRRGVRNRSGVKGVSFWAAQNKWVAEINVDKKRVYLGSFASLEEAAEARRRAEAEHHGEFARAA